MQNSRSWYIAAFVIVIIFALLLIAAQLFRESAQAAQEAAASSTVAAFGKTLQQVSLLSPDASSSMAAFYGPYVDAALLHQWQKDPAHAPGRLTSSPWPDSIAVLSLTPQGAGYIVQGAVIYMTSTEARGGGNASFVPVIMQVVPEGGTWRIVAYQPQATTTSTH